MTTKPPSDHFDGQRFFNPTLPKGFVTTRRSLLKMLREPRKPWPAWIENRGVPRLDAKLGTGEIAITFVNHATFLIQAGGAAILTDPIWSERASPFRRIGPKRVRAPGVAFDGLPPIDLVLLSHNHYDHLDVATLARLRARFDPIVLAAAGDGRLLAPLRFARTHELDWWERVRLDEGLAISFVPAQHFSARGLFDRQRSLWGGYVIESRGRRIYFGGDTGYSSHFVDIANRLGSPDIAILGIGAYEPRWFMKTVHMNPAEAVRAHRDLGSRQSIGMHFGTFQLTTEAIDQPLVDLKVALAERDIPESEFVTLQEGETRIY
ncbi:MAG TPA: MBL fold metallo-hydrolase [Xanthobacteraceae bacterium]|nr:MBL fold metallo-hydrolase [Xanthobacteraceae bacterium]